MRSQSTIIKLRICTLFSPEYCANLPMLRRGVKRKTAAPRQFGLISCPPQAVPNEILTPEPTQEPLERRLRRHPRPVAELVAKPGELALGVVPRVELGAARRLLERNLAGEMTDQPRHAVRLHRRQQRIEPARRKLPHLVQRAGGQHCVEAGVDAGIERRPIGWKEGAGPG